MTKRSEYNANQSLNETAKANKRMAHDARARHEMPEYERPIKRKRWSFLQSWELVFVLYALAAFGMWAYGSVKLH